jgi:hypothetical protein
MQTDCRPPRRKGADRQWEEDPSLEWIHHARFSEFVQARRPRTFFTYSNLLHASTPHTGVAGGSPAARASFLCSLLELLPTAAEGSQAKQAQASQGQRRRFRGGMLAADSRIYERIAIGPCALTFSATCALGSI